MQVLPPVKESKETRVLIVDDDPLLRRLCVTALRNSGLELQEAGSGEEALQCFASSRTDLVILDEFQRFSELLSHPDENPSAELAYELFNHSDALRILLSSTMADMRV